MHSFKEISNLPAGTIEQFKEVCPGLYYLFIKAFYYCNNFASTPDREGKTGMQSCLVCQGSSWEIIIINNIRYPCRSVLIPYPAGQTNPFFESPLRVNHS